MDSLTQIVLGGAVAAAIAPPGHRRAALLAGAALGTLPDLDALWLGFTAADPVANMIEHRSFSHSLLVLPWVAALIWCDHISSPAAASRACMVPSSQAKKTSPLSVNSGVLTTGDSAVKVQSGLRGIARPEAATGRQITCPACVPK